MKTTFNNLKNDLSMTRQKTNTNTNERECIEVNFMSGNYVTLFLSMKQKKIR